MALLGGAPVSRYARGSSPGDAMQSWSGKHALVELTPPQQVGSCGYC